MSPPRSSPPLAALLACVLGCGARELPRDTEPALTAAPAADAGAIATASPPEAKPLTIAASASASVEREVPPAPPPRITNVCGRPGGKTLPIKLTDLRMYNPGAPAVFTSAAQLRKRAGEAPIEGVDFARERIVHFVVHQNPNPRITSVVETAQEIVIGVDIPMYCGGAPPPSPPFDVVVPASGKPIRIDECRHGDRCTGAPRP